MDISVENAILAINNIDLKKDESLTNYTGFKTGGMADYIVVPNSAESFLAVINTLRENRQKYYILGNGSNVVAPEARYDGWIVKTEKAFDQIIFTDEQTVYCGAGVTLAVLCKECAAKGLSGMEFAFGIPGTIGGAIFMNAGAYGSEIKDVAARINVIDADGNTAELSNADMDFGYRSSAVQTKGYIVTGASFKLGCGDTAEILARMNDFMGRRINNQPLDYPSCGSTFKRPDGAYASKLIDECGLRGKSVGGAAVSEKHCGFVINTGTATSDDIFELIKLIQKTVKEKTGFYLEEEIRMLK